MLRSFRHRAPVRVHWQLDPDGLYAHEDAIRGVVKRCFNTLSMRSLQEKTGEIPFFTTNALDGSVLTAMVVIPAVALNDAVSDALYKEHS